MTQGQVLTPLIMFQSSKLFYKCAYANPLCKYASDEFPNMFLPLMKKVLPSCVLCLRGRFFHGEQQYTSSLYLVAQGILPGIVSLLFNLWSWDRLFFLTKTFQLREWSRACVCVGQRPRPLPRLKCRGQKKNTVPRLRFKHRDIREGSFVY